MVSQSVWMRLSPVLFAGVWRCVIYDISGGWGQICETDMLVELTRLEFREGFTGVSYNIWEAIWPTIQKYMRHNRDLSAIMPAPKWLLFWGNSCILGVSVWQTREGTKCKPFLWVRTLCPPPSKLRDNCVLCMGLASALKWACREYRDDILANS